MLERLLSALLPLDVREDVFAPAAADLRADRLRGLRGAWSHRAALLLIWMDSLGLVIRKERLPVLMYYLRHGFRRLRREPAFTIAAVLTLGLGIGANVSVFAVIEAVMLRPLPYPAAEELVILNHRDERTGITKEFIAIGDYVDLVARQSVFEGVGSYGSGSVTMYDGPEPFRVGALQAGPGLLDLLRMRPVLGRALQPSDAVENAAPVLMLGHRLWQTRFGGDPAMVGRSVRLGQTDYTVVGIAPAGFAFPPGADNDVIVPGTVPLSAPAERKAGWTFAVARLSNGQTVESATGQLETISRQLQQEFPQQNVGSVYYGVTLRDHLLGGTRTALLLMVGAVAVVLLIACANVANLQLVRSFARKRELAVRMALGARRGRLVTMLLAESFALSLVASVFGIALAQLGLRGLVGLVPEEVAAPGLSDVRLNWVVLLFTIGLTALTALVFGTLAAITIRVEQARDVVASSRGTTMSPRARRATTALVGVEIAMAIVLLFGAGLILRTFATLLSVDPGFQYDRVLTMGVQLPPGRYPEGAPRTAFYAGAFERLHAVPGVEAVGAGVVVPLTGNNWTVGFQRADQPIPAGQRPPDVGWQAASGGFFEALQVPLLSGRLFDPAIDRPESPPVVIISRSIEKQYFPEGSALGRHVRLGETTAEIVGVVGDIRRAALSDEPRADMYFPFERNAGNQITLFVRTAGSPERAVAPVRDALRSLEPGIVVLESQTLRQVASESVQLTRLILWLLGVFALIALVLAAVGVYGVMSYVVRQRTREIGTRMAVGASRRDILWLVMQQGIGVVAIGAGAGVAAGMFATRALRTMLYGVTPTDLPTVAVTVAALAATTVVACYIPARRASVVDPARTLTSE